jgi:hypothetical protein
MLIPHWVRKRLRMPGQVALVLGVGALSTAGSTAGARADVAVSPPAQGDVVIRSDGGKIYLSEAGGEFRELALGDTPEARRLRQLLDSSEAAVGPTGLRLNPTGLAGGGGAGFHWSPFGKSEDTSEKKSPADQPIPAGKGGTHQKPSSPAIPKAAGSNGKG